MFAAVMEDEELCKRTLERIQGFPIYKVKVHSENSIFLNSDYRGVHLDVYPDEGKNTVYDVEL